MAQHSQPVITQQQQQLPPQQAQQQPPPQQQQQQHSTSTTPQPNNNNNNNIANVTHNNQTQTVAIQQQQQQQQNNNAIASAASFTPAAMLSGSSSSAGGHHALPQAIYNQPLYIPAPGVHQSHGPMFPTMIPAQIPSNVYVNNVTANVNLHGWAHSVPTYIPSGAPHYIHGDMQSDQSATVMQSMQALPVALTAGSPGSGTSGMAGSRGSRRGRGRGSSGSGSRRGDYQNQRHPPSEGSPVPGQQQQVSQINQEQLQQQMTQQQQQQQQSQQLDPQMLAAAPPQAYGHLPQYAHAHPYPYTAYPAYFAPQNAMLHPSQTAAAQQATGTPLFVSPMPLYNPVYNYGYIYPPVMNAPDYPYVTGDEGQQGDERQNADGMLPQMWHPQQMYAEEYSMQAELQHGHHGSSDELNHNASSMASSETPSMVSPTYAVYDPHMHELQQEMSVMQIYEDPHMAQMQAMHATAQLDDELSECGAAGGGGQVTQTIQMVSAGTIITSAPMQMPNEQQHMLHHAHAQQTTHHLMQTALMPMEQPPLNAQQQQNSGAEHLMLENVVNNNNNSNSQMSEYPSLHEGDSMSSLNELSQQSTENIAQDYLQQQQQHHQQPQLQQQEQQQQHTSLEVCTTIANDGYNNKLLMTDASELLEHVPNVDAVAQAQHTVAHTYQQQEEQQQMQQQQYQMQMQQQQQQQHQQQQQPQLQLQRQEQQQQQLQTQTQTVPQQSASQSYQQHQQQHPHTHAYQQHQQQQQQQQHHQYQQYQHHYEPRKQQPPVYGNQQTRRKYSDYSTNSNYQQHQAHGPNNSDSAMQTTKSMSWTNSAKKSVAVTATPTQNNSNNNKSSNAYGHPTKTFTNQQHHYQQQQQQPHNHYNQPQTRNYGAMKMPSSPTTTTSPQSFPNERKYSQGEPPKMSNNIGSNTQLSGTTATTSTASTTATPYQFAMQQPQYNQQSQQQQQQHQHQQQQPHSQSGGTAASDGGKQYPGFTYKRPHVAHVATTAAVVASASPEVSLAPPINMAPPASTVPVANSSTPSWASLFASKSSSSNNQTVAAPAAAASPLSTGLAAAAAPPQSQLQNNNNNNTVANSVASGTANLSAAYPPPFSAKKPIAKVAPYEGLTPVTPAPPVVTPGALSYSAASAQGLPPPAAAVPVAVKKLETTPPPMPQRNNAHLDEWTHKYSDFLNKHKTDLASVSLRPRGLTNRSNYCYINSILQALLGCAPFYNLIRALPKQVAALSDVKTPTVNAMISFMSNFSTQPAGLRLRTTKGPKGKDELGAELQCDTAFEPTEIYKLWNDSREEHVEGRQEDAEEFLGYVLNKLNDEMLEVIKLIAKPSAEQNGQNEQPENDEGDVWQMICNNRNKGSVTRQTDFGRTPLSDIFRGELRSRLQREGELSTDVIQPFFTLQLNIERAASVKEALEILVGRDQLEGVTGSKTKQEVVAWQQMTLEKLPVVLILHLKWFDYRSDGCTKILKKVEFPVELKIDAKILASKKYSQKQRAYRLFAVVYHDGKEASKGHYITDVFHTGYGSWLRYDDSSVKPVSENHVLLPRTPRVPYLLYYRRSDTMPQSTAAVNNAAFPNSATSSSSSQQSGK